MVIYASYSSWKIYQYNYKLKVEKMNKHIWNAENENSDDLFDFDCLIFKIKLQEFLMTYNGVFFSLITSCTNIYFNI